MNMNMTETEIINLQYRLNLLVEDQTSYTDAKDELYHLSQELDQLIVKYYKEYTA